ncbi:Alpha/beta hydrolase fold protein [Gymnopus androsaceus JB14]|uniref:Alpha/beta hydrolase fold protein n=1 Tax=Gymnopus androsaceus JB14 TaxID=1447944 RepID=A0A6A4HC83_9AGAR|nr:Alpha/beta hydrolase fold protein [Gymnopus androsaceus JB14]
MSATQVLTIEADGVEVFYREAGKKDAPVVLLLHGFPTSSFQYRNLITKLAGDYRVIAPDLPGFWIYQYVPETRKYEYTFDNFGKTIEVFVDALNLKKYAIYIFDYGAPVGLKVSPKSLMIWELHAHPYILYRLALARPSAITAIVSQNGNAFKAGFGDVWKPIFKYWEEPTFANRQAIAGLTKFASTKSQYESGEAHPERIPPETYHLDQALMDRPGNADIQLDIFLNYQTNVIAYPSFHEYFREHQPPLLAIWGKNDAFFIPPGAEAFKTVLPKAEVHFVDGGHFSLENHLDEIASKMIEFLKRNGV